MAQAAQPGGDGQQQQQPSVFQRLLQMFLWYQIISWGIKSFTKSSTPQVDNTPSKSSLTGDRDVDTYNTHQVTGPWQSGETEPNYVFTSNLNHKNYWRQDTPYNMRFVTLLFFCVLFCDCDVFVTLKICF